MNPVRAHNTTLFDRRMLIVLTCLVASMTIASSLLMAFLPRPIAPSGQLSLAVLESSDQQRLERIYQLPVDPAEHGWQAIVIHHSGQESGDAASLGRLHQELGYGGLGWHFLIGNGQGMTDGQLEDTYRWTYQIDGVYVPKAISICLVGNGDRSPPTAAQMKQLIRLVRSLQRHLSIPAERVFLHAEKADTTSPGRLFPSARFRAALLDRP